MQREKQQPRRTIRAQTINYGVEARDMLDNLTVAPGLNISRGQGGIVISLGTDVSQAVVAIASGTITARSGTTAGTGTVTLTSLTITAGGVVYFNTGTSLTVYNPFSKTIANGTYVTIRTNNGVWEIIGADCP